MVQRELHYAIVDEVDNILIDEARTPLIISGPAEEATDYYDMFARMVPRLQRGTGLHHRAADALDPGRPKRASSKMEQLLGVQQPVRPGEHAADPLPRQRDEGPVPVPARRSVHRPGRRDRHRRRVHRPVDARPTLQRGLHQAIEAKEGVRVQRENVTLARITFQNYFRLYEKLAGMTGTAMTEREEFQRIYNLDVVPIPTHRPMVRDDHATWCSRPRTPSSRRSSRRSPS